MKKTRGKNMSSQQKGDTILIMVHEFGIWNRAREYAIWRGLSLSRFVEEAVYEYLKDPPKPEPEKAPKHTNLNFLLRTKNNGNR